MKKFFVFLGTIFFVVSLYRFGVVYGESSEVEGGFCVSCHLQEEKKKLRSPVEQWEKSVHAANYTSCDGCHGGNPRSQEKDEAKADATGYMGKPEEEEIPEFCGQCHERQKESYFDGPHGEALKDFDDAPVCSSCHGIHGIQSPSLEEIMIEDECTDCHEFDDADNIKTHLLKIKKDLKNARNLLDNVRTLGMDITFQESEFRDIKEEIGTLAHIMEVDQTSRRAPQLLARIEKTKSGLEALRLEGTHRRSVGIVSMVFFAVIALVVMGYRKTFRP